MKRVWSQITVNKAEQEAKEPHEIINQRIRMVNSLARQIDRSGCITVMPKPAEPDDTGERITLEVDIVVMTIEEARFLMKHARDVTSDELDMALQLQKDAEHLFLELEQIPKEPLPIELNDRRNEQ